ncbi:MAG: hypothetical protein EOO88_09115 [Pedobacter sp.]|nr:MAG: hypothetical protein EOO88_09115 [Pedobacter sp.]
MTKQNWRLLLFFLLSVSLSLGCKKKQPVEADPPDTTESNLVSASVSGSYSSTQLKLLAQLGGYADAIPLVKYDVNFIKILYKTTYKGNEITASGSLVIPKNMTAVPSVISAQHGTTFLAAAAPSNVPAVAAFTGYELLSAAGFVTVIPDFIGYGVSKNVVHPYYDMQHSALAVTDMLKAVTAYLKREKIAFNERLFMIGYSEGGYVTMAAQKSIEANPIAGLSLRAVAAGAGGYDITSMLSTIISNGTYSDPAYLALILNSYNVTYGWNRPLTDFFKEPYAGRIPALLDGTKDAGTVSAQLSANPTVLLNPAFYANMRDANEEKVLKAAFVSNSFLNFVPVTATRLYHGTADETVFYQSSQVTFDKFKAGGATKVELIPVPGGTHESTVLPMMLSALPWFQSLDK